MDDLTFWQVYFTVISNFLGRLSQPKIQPPPSPTNVPESWQNIANDNEASASDDEQSNFDEYLDSVLAEAAENTEDGEYDVDDDDDDNVYLDKEDVEEFGEEAVYVNGSDAYPVEEDQQEQMRTESVRRQPFEEDKEEVSTDAGTAASIISEWDSEDDLSGESERPEDSEVEHVSDDDDTQLQFEELAYEDVRHACSDEESDPNINVEKLQRMLEPNVNMCSATATLSPLYRPQ
ncbi:hypothetical protein CYMTET_25966 [Cymbomonas tetramitiformis]|uniref:Uncharacterized protein n=1 Tax=Cymbomonas tetramitiformis TaxID=36881 RepID=A0AAE0KYP8_9CHLO|nr:hypothetical protein CYMTET_25966 [Cymbomonas tetramitiformis]|eukprot:gene7045-8401_t